MRRAIIATLPLRSLTMSAFLLVKITVYPLSVIFPTDKRFMHKFGTYKVLATLTFFNWPLVLVKIDAIPLPKMCLNTLLAKVNCCPTVSLMSSTNFDKSLHRWAVHPLSKHQLVSSVPRLAVSS